MPTLIDRARSLFKARAAAPARTAVVSTMRPTWANGQPQYSAANYEIAVREGYRKNELIYACIEATANTAASVSLRVYSKGDGEALPDHPLRVLITRPNPFMSEFDFWHHTMVNLKLAGVAYWQKIRNNAGDVIQLWPMRPDWTAIVPAADALIGGYVYGQAGGTPTELAATDVLAFRLHDPLDLYRSTSPVMVAARVADVDNSATDFIKMFWEKGGVPIGVLSSKLRLEDYNVDDIRHRWQERYGGFQNWLAPAILDMDSTYQRIGMTFQEMGFADLDGRNEARICMTLGVPPIIIGTAMGLARSTFSNYAEARTAWWEDMLTPQYKMLADRIELDLVDDFGDGVTVKWDFSKVPAFQEDQHAKWARATAALTAGGLTVNEFRLQVGLATLGNAGDVLYRSSMTTASPINDKVAAQADSANPDVKAADPTQPDQTQADSDKLTADYAKQMGDLAAQAASGAITAAAFEAGMTTLIREAAIAQALAAGPIDATDMARINADVQKQADYLNGFAASITAMDEATARDRATLYARSSRSQYWKQASPVPLDCYPGDGQSECKTNCSCSLTFDSKSTPGYCLVTWNPGDSVKLCDSCQYFATAWKPLKVKL